MEDTHSERVWMGSDVEADVRKHDALHAMHSHAQRVLVILGFCCCQEGHLQYHIHTRVRI